MMKIKKVNNKAINKMTLKTTKMKSQILTLLKTIIRILKELEKYVSMIRKYKKIKRENLILRNNEIRFLIKLKQLIMSWLNRKNN